MSEKNYPTRARSAERFAAAFVLVLVAASPAAAQPDPPDLSATAAFLSRATFNGRPTLVTAPDAEAAALGQLEAVPVGPDLYTSAKLDGLTFEVFRAPNPPDLLPVQCEDPQRNTPPCPDIESITYRDRSCYEDVGIIVTESCSPLGDGTYVKKWDPAKTRCRLASPGSFCTEIRVIGWHYQHYADSCCQLEIPGKHEEYTALRCSLCG
ncbi:MAG: hypothetical protein KDD47_06980 [Acidobacteria bacterium]|nr:hypothetical protein [Acidobacteriota bacterium]